MVKTSKIKLNYITTNPTHFISDRLCLSRSVVNISPFGACSPLAPFGACNPVSPQKSISSSTSESSSQPSPYPTSINQSQYSVSPANQSATSYHVSMWHPPKIARVELVPSVLRVVTIRCPSSRLQLGRWHPNSTSEISLIRTPRR